MPYGWNIQNETLLDPVPGHPNGYVTSDGEWAAVPLVGCKKFIIIHNGSPCHTSRNYPSAVSYIKKQLKKSKKKCK